MRWRDYLCFQFSDNSLDQVNRRFSRGLRRPSGYFKPLLKLLIELIDLFHHARSVPCEDCLSVTLADSSGYRFGGKPIAENGDALVVFHLIVDGHLARSVRHGLKKLEQAFQPNNPGSIAIFLVEDKRIDNQFAALGSSMLFERHPFSSLQPAMLRATFQAAIAGLPDRMIDAFLRNVK